MSHLKVHQKPRSQNVPIFFRPYADQLLKNEWVIKYMHHVTRKSPHRVVRRMDLLNKIQVACELGFHVMRLCTKRP